MGNVSFAHWLGAAAALVILVAIAEAYDPKLAMGLAIVTLLALFLRYPQAITQIRAMLGL